ncbi:MAG TPA: serpin family protein [Clostridia bacterium]
MTKCKKLISMLSVTSVLAASLCLQVPCNAANYDSRYDINGDGKVNSKDLAEFKRILLDPNIYYIPLDLSRLDINGDGKVNSLDYVLLKRYIMTPVVETSDDVYKANTNFAFDVFKELNKEDIDKNVTISPLSISTAVSMAYQGANGTTKDAIANALRYKGLGIDTVNKSYKDLLGYLNQADPKVSLSVNNSIWYRDGFTVKDDFLSVNKDVFNSYISSIDFSKPDAADTINTWISDATKGKIPSMINPPIADDLMMYLINAVYFKGQWMEVFNPDKSSFGSFINGQNMSKNVVYMHKRGAGEFGSGTGYKAIRLPYGDGKIAMYCILPDEGTGINDFINKLDSSKWDTIKQSIKKSDDLELTLPRFKVEYGTESLKKSLSAMGMGEAFKTSADFSGIAPELFISDVLHKSVVEVNEKGTEAAAVTVVPMNVTAIPPVVHDIFDADRPFVFVIADDKTGTILFMGKAADIEEPMQTINIGAYNGKHILIKKGQNLKVELLGSNCIPFDYNYDLSKSSDQTVLKYLSMNSKSAGISVGSPVTYNFVYQAVGTGSTTLELTYETTKYKVQVDVQ